VFPATKNSANLTVCKWNAAADADSIALICAVIVSDEAVAGLTSGHCKARSSQKTYQSGVLVILLAQVLSHTGRRHAFGLSKTRFTVKRRSFN
jgi:hypothetical protein